MKDPKDYRQRVKYQLIASIVIAGAGGSGSVSAAQTDRLYNYVTGLAATIKGDENGFQNSVFNQFQIDSNEIFPEGYEAKLIGTTRNTDVRPNDKYYELQDGDGNRLLYPANNSKVDIKYADGSFAGVAYPYTLQVWLRLENVDEEQYKEENRLVKALKKLVKEFKD